MADRENDISQRIESLRAKYNPEKASLPKEVNTASAEEDSTKNNFDNFDDFHLFSAFGNFDDFKNFENT